jgi:hypothetical protein
VAAERGRSSSVYGARIARGPMGGDQYTQIHNNVFRDPRTSAKAKGVFGHCSTHQDGWHVTAKSIAKDMRDGVDAINGALNELEKYAYLIRFRARDEKGRLGEAVYFVTDLPAQLLDLELPDEVVADRVRRAFDRWIEENGMSAPERRNPVQGSTSGNADEDPGPGDNSGPEDGSRRSEPEPDFPEQANPEQANPGTKKTRPPEHQEPEDQTGATLAPDPQRTDGTTTSSHRPGDNNGSPTAGTGGSEGDHQTARADLSIGPNSPAVNDLAVLLAIAHPRGITQQQAVTRAFRILVDATRGDDFRRAIEDRLIHARPSITRAQAKDEVRDRIVLDALTAAAEVADAAIKSRRAGNPAQLPQDATTPPPEGDHSRNGGADDQERVSHASRIKAKYGAVTGPVELAVAG